MTLERILHRANEKLSRDRATIESIKDVFTPVEPMYKIGILVGLLLLIQGCSRYQSNPIYMQVDLPYMHHNKETGKETTRTIVYDNIYIGSISMPDANLKYVINYEDSDIEQYREYRIKKQGFTENIQKLLQVYLSDYSNNCQIVENQPVGFNNERDLYILTKLNKFDITSKVLKDSSMKASGFSHSLNMTNKYLMNITYNINGTEKTVENTASFKSKANKENEDISNKIVADLLLATIHLNNQPLSLHDQIGDIPRTFWDYSFVGHTTKTTYLNDVLLAQMKYDYVKDVRLKEKIVQKLFVNIFDQEKPTVIEVTNHEIKPLVYSGITYLLEDDKESPFSDSMTYPEPPYASSYINTSDYKEQNFHTRYFSILRDYFSNEGIISWLIYDSITKGIVINNVK